MDTEETTQNENVHYICKGGCRGVSKTPGTCQDLDCPKSGHELERCDCADDQHNDFK